MRKVPQWESSFVTWLLLNWNFSQAGYAMSVGSPNNKKWQINLAQAMAKLANKAGLGVAN